MLRPLIRSGFLLALASCFLFTSFRAAQAGTFNWADAAGTWSTPGNWTPPGSPSGTDPTDILVFGGDVGSVAGSPPNYTSTNDISVVPFMLNGITLQATDINNQPTDPPIVIAGNALRFTGASPNITQNGAGPITFTTPISLSSGLAFDGNGTGVVTLNRGLSGSGDLVKSGTSTFRFGTFPISPAVTAPSENTWMGNLVINGGTVRFNNNADSGRTALRANGVMLSVGATLTCASQLRSGVLTGPGGLVESQVTVNNSDNEDLVITALDNGAFGGTVRLGPPRGTGNDTGTFIVRGPGVQTLSGLLNIEKDVAVAGSLVFSGAASLGSGPGAQFKGALILQGGKLRLDNVGLNNNNNNRLRDADASSTGIDLIGGGVFTLDGNETGTSETVGRLQLGSLAGSTPRTRPRSGHLNFDLIHRGGATVLSLQGYNRDATTASPLNTVEFSAHDASGAVLELGQLGNTPRVFFNSLPNLANSNSLFPTTTTPIQTGWAVVRTPTGLAFATHDPNGGVTSVGTTPDWVSSATSHIETGSSQTVSGTFSAASLRLVPTSAGQQITLDAGASLNTTGIILTGGNDFEIGGAGLLTGNGPRFIFVDSGTLRLSAGIAAAQPLVKSGAGTLVLTGNNANNQKSIAINQGVLRVRLSPSSVPGGDLQFRGGVLEFEGGGTFSRAFVVASQVAGPGTINWSGSELTGSPAQPNNLVEDRGSGGFAALGGNVTVDLGSTGAGLVRWEDRSFLQSGYALILGSASADSTITLIDNFNLTSVETIINYNAREIRVLDNPSSPNDKAVLSGIIGGTIHNDLLKTGPGRLELSGACTFLGAAIIQEGTLAVNGSISQSIVADVRSGATLTGSGAVNAMILEAGGTLAPGNNGVGTLTGTSLIWRGNGTGRFDLGAGAASDKVDLGTGALLKGSDTGPFTIDFGGTGTLGQSYTLITFGSTNFAASDFAAANLAPGVTGAFQISGGSLLFVTDAPPAPEVVTGNSTNVVANSAVVDGTVNPRGGATTARFEFGTTTSYGSFVDVTPAPGTGFTAVPVSATLANLLPNTLYHFRLVATNQTATIEGLDNTFTTPAGTTPTVVTTAASSVVDVAATLNGSVNPNTLDTTAYFEYGLTTAYGQTANVTAPGNGSAAVPVSARITGLLPSTEYHFRLVAQNSAGTTVGDDLTFATLAVSTVPQPANDSLFVSGRAATINVLANDVNPVSGDSNGLTFDGVVTQPLFGTVTGQGTLTYTPNGNLPATGDSFTYRVKNAADETAEAQVSIRTFSSMKGSFAATIEEDGPAVSDTGSVSVTLSSTGKSSAKLIWARKSYALKGNVAADGTATFVQGGLTLRFDLNADGTAPGTLEDASAQQMFAFSLTRAAADNEGLLIGPGVYTAWLPGDATLPGTGYVVATVDKKRNARFAGKLSDGQPFADASKLFAHHYVLDPLLYKVGKKTYSGQLRSEVQFAGGQTVGSEAEWFKAPVPGDSIYPNGVATTLPLEGEKFIAAGASGFSAITAALGGTSVQLVLEGGNLPATAQIPLTLTPTKVIVGATTLQNVTVKLNAKQGIFSGTFTHPVSLQKTTFGGAFRSGQSEGRGHFRGVDIPGNVRITSTP